MAQLVAATFSPQEMPRIFDPAGLANLRPEEFVVVPREPGEDVAFVTGFEYRSVQQLKLRREPYPRVLRRASEDEVEAWWERKGQERRAMVIAKEKARALKLDIKISRVRYDTVDRKATFHFTSDTRIDFRALVKELSAILRMRIELWQIGVRDEARLVDGFGVCGLQTCCSTWLKEFRPINIRMAKQQDIALPPSKLSGQCGRLLCCLSYEVDQYKAMAKEALPKGATITYEGRDFVIIDRNLIRGTYVVSDGAGTVRTVKGSELDESTNARVPEQMKKQGRRMAAKASDPVPDSDEPTRDEVVKEAGDTSAEYRAMEVPMSTGPLVTDPEQTEGTEEDSGGERSRRSSRRGRSRGRGRNKPGGEAPQGPNQQASPPPERREKNEDKTDGDASGGGRQKKRRRGRRRPGGS